LRFDLADGTGKEAENRPEAEQRQGKADGNDEVDHDRADAAHAFGPAKASGRAAIQTRHMGGPNPIIRSGAKVREPFRHRRYWPIPASAPIYRGMSDLGRPIPTHDPLADRIRACRICAERFAATATAHAPRPVVWFRPGARMLVAGQAPGARVHASGRPFTDPSGDRLRDWLGIDEATFYDLSGVAVVPMAFCFPGYNAKKADLPPPPICAHTWHGQVMDALDSVELKILVGGHAHRWHMGRQVSVTRTVANWRDHAPRVFPLPHPSWRNTGWLKKNPWFETELLPVLRARVAEVLS
tara:strand:- start:667 stop:1560 length:894 start_codon:yes stop_codon:yes gene_type:complete